MDEPFMSHKIMNHKIMGRLSVGGGNNHNVRRTFVAASPVAGLPSDMPDSSQGTGKSEACPTESDTTEAFSGQTPARSSS